MQFQLFISVELKDNSMYIQHSNTLFRLYNRELIFIIIIIKHSKTARTVLFLDNVELISIYSNN